jgi:CPA2 family monovalent cation:H+ antiporter-2
MVLALVLLPALAAVMGGAPTVPRDPFVGVFERFTGLRADGWLVAAIVVVKFAAFIGFMIVVGRRVVPWGLAWVAATGSRELSRLAVAALALAVAAGAAYLFGTSLALGAFFAGMILREDDLANRAARAVLPLREAFAVPLFVGIGMLAEPRLLGAAPLPLLGTLLVILVARPVLTGLAGALTRQPVGTLVPAAAQLAQIGEFAVLLGVTGVGLGLLPAAGGDLIVLGVAFSLVVNPALVRLADMARPRLEAGLAARRPGVVLPNRVEPALAGTAPAPAEAAAPAAGETRPPTLKAGHVVLVGYGRVGRVVADGLSRQNTPFVVIEAAEARAAAALAAGLEAFAGNAATAEPQALANVAGAKTLLVSGGDGFEAGQVVARARRSNPALTIVARARDAAEADHLRAAGATEVITGAREIGLGLLGWSNGDNAHEAATTRARESFEAVAAALKLEALPPAPVEPVLPVAAPAAVPPAVPPAAPPLGRAERPATRAGVPYRAAGE